MFDCAISAGIILVNGYAYLMSNILHHSLVRLNCLVPRLLKDLDSDRASVECLTGGDLPESPLGEGAGRTVVSAQRAWFTD